MIIALRFVYGWFAYGLDFSWVCAWLVGAALVGLYFNGDCLW